MTTSGDEADPGTIESLSALRADLADAKDRLDRAIVDRDALATELRRANRALRALSESNRAIAYLRDEASLQEEVCRVIVEAAGYKMAWIGVAQADEARSVRPVAQAGFEQGYVALANVSWDEASERGRGPMGVAIRSRRPVVVRDVETDPDFAPWRAQAIERGYGSTLTVPFMLEGDDGREIVAVIGIYAPESEAFDSQEVKFLQDLATDLAFGLSRLRLERVRRKQEDELLRRDVLLQQARQLAQLKARFVSSLSHDLRTPLTSLFGYLEFLADGFDDGLTPTQRDLVSKLDRTARRIETLVDDLLDYARLDAGTFELDRAEFDLAAQIQEVLEVLENQAREANVRLVSEPAADPLPILGDSPRLERVLINLVQNAVKFSPTQGEVVVRADRRGPLVRVEVADAGPGVAIEDCARIFTPFVQLEGGRRKGGTGLGLSIAKAIVEAHQGRIGVESEPGRGSTFWFELPVLDA